MALAGVAWAFQAGCSLTYLAEIWAEPLPYSLLWRIAYFHFHNQMNWSETTDFTILEPGTRTAPSWSWFKQPNTNHITSSTRI
jgi:hypothetical protein